MAHTYELVMNALRRYRCDAVFGVIGAGNLGLIPLFEQTGAARYFAARTEAGSVNMADGFARSSGRIGVCTTTHGPAMTNCFTALATAARERAALVLIAADTARTSYDHPHRIDQHAVVAATGALFQQLHASSTAAADIDRAFRMARDARMPVVLNAPVDIFEGPLSAKDPSDVPAGVSGLESPSHPDPESVARAARMLGSAKRCVILAGRGAFASGAASAIAKLADRIGALVGTTLRGKDMFHGHDFNLGIVGSYSPAEAAAILSTADCVLVFGSSLDGWVTRRGKLFPEARIIQCDADPRTISNTTPVSVALVGDARATAGALLAAVAKSTGTIRQEFEKHRQAIQSIGQAAAHASNNHRHPRKAVMALNRLLPRDRTIVVDNGHFATYALEGLTVPDPSGFLWTGGFGAVGSALGTAIGAAIARPDRLAVAVIGDGGLMMALPELDTAARYSIPLVVAVINDGAYGSELHYMRLDNRPVEQSLFRNPSFADVARSLGLDGVTVANVDEFDRIADRVKNVRRPLLLDISTDHDIRSEWFTGFAATRVG